MAQAGSRWLVNAGRWSADGQQLMVAAKLMVDAWSHDEWLMVVVMVDEWSVMVQWLMTT